MPGAVTTVDRLAAVCRRVSAIVEWKIEAEQRAEARERHRRRQARRRRRQRADRRAALLSGLLRRCR